VAKRSYIKKDRLGLLNSENSIYGITCYQSEYYCKDHKNERCKRGFFSLFLQAVYGIQFANNLGLPYYVDFGNLNYSYSEEERFEGNKNFWDYYFCQQVIPANSRVIYNSRFETYPLKIWDRGFIRQLNQTVISNLKFKDDILKAIDELKVRFSAEKILGIHIRKTDHFNEVEPAKDTSILRKVDEKIRAFDKLFLATDDQEILRLFQKKYGEKLIFNPFYRSSGVVAIHGSEKNSNGFQLGKEALLDCLSLSFCNHVILSPSNLSYCVLVFNPELKYELVESRTAKWHRLKTLGAYFLNKWGIRKW
jgi:hypothetical protein